MGSLAGVTGAAALGLAFGRDGTLRADSLSAVAAAAQASSPAVRIPPGTGTLLTGTLLMPVDPLDGGLVCLNNFNGFSNANGPCGHRGVDIGELVDNTPGRPLLACVDGVIERDEVAGPGGLMRILRGDDGRWYRYHHLDAYSADVAPDDRVTAGQVIGFMGRTGNTSWTHLHFEVWADSLIPRDGTALDPFPLIAWPLGVQLDDSRACSSATTTTTTTVSPVTSTTVVTPTTISTPGGSD